MIADEDGTVVVPQQVEAEAPQKPWDKVNAANEVRDAIRNCLKATQPWEKFGML